MQGVSHGEDKQQVAALSYQSKCKRHWFYSQFAASSPRHRPHGASFPAPEPCRQAGAKHTPRIICPELLGGGVCGGEFLKSLFGSGIQIIAAFASIFSLRPQKRRHSRDPITWEVCTRSVLSKPVMKGSFLPPLQLPTSPNSRDGRAPSAASPDARGRRAETKPPHLLLASLWIRVYRARISQGALFGSQP